MADIEKTKAQEIIKEALRRYDEAISGTSTQRELQKDDLRFLSGEQWPEKTKKDREADDQPCLVINRLPKYIDQVVNDLKQNSPQIKVRPKDSNIDVDTADVRQGLLRHIQNNGNSKAAIDCGASYAVMSGVGWFRIISEYCDDDTFDQELRIKRIDNPLSVVAPMHLCQEADYSDMPYLFIVAAVSKEEYKTLYPDSNLSDFEGDNGQNWVEEDQVVIAEYYRVKTDTKKLYKLLSGEVVETLPEGVKAESERSVPVKTVEWYKISAVDVLDSTIFPGKYIPVIPIVGNEINVDGKRHYISLTRNAKDSQRLINYYKSCKAERIALAPKSPYIAADGQIEPYKDIWKDSNKKNIAVLPYKPVSNSGVAVPPPIRANSIGVDSGLVEAEREAIDDLKATTGIFDASMGAKGNETSGKAILARQQEGDNANYHFVDNQATALTLAGKIINDIIPEIYDTPRTIRILGDDYKEKVVRVNEQYIDPTSKKQKYYNLSVGKYDIVVDVGPSYKTQRIEAVDHLTEIMSRVPIIGEAVADIVMRNMDFPGAEEAADRMVKVLEFKYPGLVEKKDGEEIDVQAVVQDLQTLMQQNQMSEQLIQQMDAVIQQLQGELESKDADRQADLLKNTQNNQTKIQTTQMQIDANQVQWLADAINTLVSKVGSLEQRINSPASAQTAESKSVGE